MLADNKFIPHPNVLCDKWCAGKFDCSSILEYLALSCRHSKQIISTRFLGLATGLLSTTVVCTLLDLVGWESTVRNSQATTRCIKAYAVKGCGAGRLGDHSPQHLQLLVSFLFHKYGLESDAAMFTTLASPGPDAACWPTTACLENALGAGA